jgi:3-hydroxymyristoyl/3-hydroxydecanoyl-(acyl carrier protein) dehydratase
MDDHFRAFSFVDRIASVLPEGRIRGRYAIPSRISSFAASLVAEATGQLAAWAAMAAVDFERRPVAGIAGCVELGPPVQPGQVLDLSAEIETVDADAVAYGGVATVDGIPVLQLHRCVGPMVPVSDFDDPQALRDRFALLCGPGAMAGGFDGIPSLVLERNGGEPAQWIRARLTVPQSAALFADHFPRRPVFPGSLLMHSNLELAGALASEASSAPGLAWTLREITDMKLRAFIAPGEILEIEARMAARAEESAVVKVETRNGQRTIGSARVRLSLEKLP